MKKVFSIGGATQDIFLLYEGAETMHLFSQKRERAYLLFEQGTKVDIPSLHYATGGGATNAGISFKRLGLSVEIFFKIGTDTAGQFIHAEMLKEEVGISSCMVDPQVSTAISFIVPSQEHNHVALCYRGANTKLTPDEFPFGILPTVDYVYIGPLPGHSGELLPLLATKAKELHKPVATNPSMTQIMHGSDQLIAAFHALEIVIVNAYEAAHLMKAFIREKALKIERRDQSPPQNPQSPQLLTEFMTLDDETLTIHDYFDQVLSRGPSIAVVTNGKEGVYVATKDLIYFHPSLKTAVMYGLGAGDALSAAFIGSLVLGKSIETAILYGVINASSVIHFADAKEGLLTLEELERRASGIGLEKLQKFPLKKRS